jgi:hypothetical protein
LKEEGMNVVPIGIPGRGELWHRVQLARAVLNHRAPDAATVTIALCALDGTPIETLMKRQSGPQVLGFAVDWQQIARDVGSACIARNITQARLAAALGVSRRTVGRMLRGEVLAADVLVTVVAWLYPDEPRPKWVVSAVTEEAV